MNTRLFSSYSMDFTFEIHHAQREDGMWFSRRNEKTAFGYQWSKWERINAPDLTGKREVFDASCRLPIDGAKPWAKRGPSCKGLRCRKGATIEIVYSICGMEMDSRLCCGSAECRQRFIECVGAKMDVEITTRTIAA